MYLTNKGHITLKMVYLVYQEFNKEYRIEGVGAVPKAFEFLFQIRPK